MPMHPRTTLVTEAERKIVLAILDATEGLTTAERLQAINRACAGEIGSICKYAIRHERHPDDPDKPGDEA